MWSNKPITSATFTNRVDRANRPGDAGHPSQPLLCEQCGAVFIHHRWASAGIAETLSGRREWRPAEKTICPSCQQAEEGIPSGYVYVDGDFLNAHRDELRRLIRKEASRATEQNPLSRIVRIEDADQDRLTVETTTEHLAQRLGHALEQAYGGYVRYGFSHHNRLARVWWHRD